MSPGQFYKKTFTGKDLQKGTATYKGKNINSLPHKFFDGIVKMSFINYLNVPTERDIIAIQLENVKKSFPMNIALSNQINSFAQERKQLNNMSDLDFSMEEMLEIIEAVFTISFPDDGSTNNMDVINALSNRLKKDLVKNGKIDNYEKALDRLWDVYNMFQQDQDFINEVEIKDLIQKLEKAIMLLETDIANSNDGIYASRKQRGTDYFGDNWRAESGMKVGKGTKKKEAKYNEKIIGYGNILKGRWFERQVIEFIKNRVINPKEVGIIDLANVKTLGNFDIFGKSTSNSAVKSRVDAALIDLTKDIQISYYINGKLQTTDLQTFMNNCNEANGKGDTISVPVEEWKKLFNSGGISGMQMKSGKKRNIINEYSVSAPEAYAAAGEIWTWFLLRILDWYKFGNIYATRPDIYDAIFNYGISHAMLHIIGMGNDYIAFRDRIVPTYIYFEEQARLAKYMRARKPVDLNKINQRIPVNLASTPASFGHTND